ncbi:hypothetical protein HN371_00435 [Candidatus Poribacteria bacterium]|nr:hypothetical protein [Candidatus Poribacteria bacterium]MBT7808462.1 hypothetical protein [Candidatus Poribacteria bacterium]
MFAFAGPVVLRRCRIVALCAFVLGSVAGVAAAQTIDYPDFSDPAELRLVGDATTDANRLRLVRAVNNQVGAAWYVAKQNVANAWQTDFSFQGSEIGGGNGSDGFAFVVQNSSLDALGGAGGGLGYHGIANSLAVEFDTYNNGEPSGNHVSVHSRGTEANSVEHIYSLGHSSDIPSFQDGALHVIRIIYDPGTLFVYIDDMTIPRLVIPLDLDHLLNLDAGAAWVGLTGGTGGGYQNHDILHWRHGPRDGPGSPLIALLAPTDGTTVQTGSASMPVTVAMLDNPNGHWHWSLDSPFPESGPAGGTMVAAGSTAVIEFPGGLQDGVTHTIYVVPVDASHQVVGSQTSTTFAVADGVSIPDPVLLAAIRALVGRPTGVITVADMASFVQLDASGGVQDLTGMEHATGLRYLFLRSNQIADLGPLASLTDMVQLGLEGNAISELTPLSGLTNLDWLAVSQNPVSDISPITALTMLRAFYADSTQISDVSPLASLPILATFTLRHSRISDLGPLAGSTHLTSFSIWGAQVVDLTPLVDLTGLTWLDVGANRITDVTPLATLTNLGVLYITSNQVTDVTPLAGLTGLQELYADSNQITDISPLWNLPSLREVDVRGNPLILPERTIVPPLEMNDGVGFRWAIHPTGQLKRTTGDAYERGHRLRIDGGAGLVDYRASPTVLTEHNGRQLVMGPFDYGGIEVTRKIYVPRAGGFARYMEVLSNPTGIALPISLELTSRMNHSIPAVVAGPGTLDELATTDNWVITDDSYDGVSGYQPNVAHVFAGDGGALRPTQADYTPNVVTHRYDVIVPAGGVSIVVHFAVQRDTVAEAVAAAQELSLLDGLALEGVTAEELSTFSNFPTAAGGVGIPAAVSGPERVGPRSIAPIAVSLGAEAAQLDAASLTMLISPAGVLEYDHYEVDGTLFEGSGVTVNADDPTRLKLVLNHSGVDGVTGSGDLARIYLRAVGEEDATATVTLTELTLADSRAERLVSYIGSGSVVVALSCKPGDSNGDGALDILDVTKVERIVARLDDVPLSACPDANQDDVTNVLDVTSTERLVVGLPAVALAPQAARAPLVSLSTTSDTGDVVTLRVDVSGVLHDVDASSFEVTYAEGDYELLSLNPTGWHANASRVENDSSSRAIRVLNAPGVGGMSLSGSIVEISLRRKSRDANSPIALDVHIGDTSGRSLLLRSFSIPMWRIPDQTAALPNFPNPFNPETWIPFDLADSASVTVDIYSPAGRVIRTIDLGRLPAGPYRDRSRAAYWDGRNATGERVGSGVYLYRLRADGFSAIQRMLILK